MSWIDGLRHRVFALFRPEAHARDVEREMQFHLELDAMHQRDPRLAALRFGNRTYYREAVRRATWYGQLDVLRQDVRYAWRSLRRNPVFTVMTVLTLTLGVGLNAASFALLDVVFFRYPSGLASPGDLRRVYMEHFETGNGEPIITGSVSYPVYRALLDARPDTAPIALYATDNALRMGPRPRDPRLRGVYASASYFHVLGVRTSLGRVFDAFESVPGGGVPVTVLSHRFWQRQFAGDSGVIGRSMMVESRKHVIIGVAAEGFDGLDAQPTDVFMPLSSFPQPSWLKDKWWDSRRLDWFAAIYRPGSPETQRMLETRATAGVRALARAATKPDADTLARVLVASFNASRGPGVPGFEMRTASQLAVVSTIVLVIACANVINLLLARAMRRRHEFALRLSLGISRARLFRLLATETLLISLVVVGPALLAAWWGGTLLRALLMPQVNWVDDVLTWRVVAFSCGITTLAGLVAGIVPAVLANRASVGDALKASTRTGGIQRSRLRNTLVMAQAALSVVLLAGAALFVQSLDRVQSLDIGYDSRQLVFGYPTFARDERPSRPALNTRMRELATRIASRPAVTAVARVSIAPMLGVEHLDFYTESDSSASLGREGPNVTAVTPSFFDAVGLQFIRGTSFTRGDGDAAPREVVVNQALAERLWPGGETIGQCMRLQARDKPCHLVVGIVENARRTSVLESQPELQFYLPLGTEALPSSGATIIVRTTAPHLAAQELRVGLSEAFPQALAEVHTMAEQLEPEYRPWQLGAALFSLFGALALLVAIIGIYSTVTYNVAQRTHEFGVRIALGAQVADVLRQVVGEGIRVALLGVIVGLLMALASGQLVESMLYGIAPNDPATLALVSVVLLAVAALAALVPAWRAARVDPMTALRSE